jgi:hypothetical protein
VPFHAHRQEAAGQRLTRTGLLIRANAMQTEKETLMVLAATCAARRGVK